MTAYCLVCFDREQRSLILILLSAQEERRSSALGFSQEERRSLSKNSNGTAFPHVPPPQIITVFTSTQTVILRD